MDTYIKKFSEIGIADVPVVGGKNASLGEMFSNLTQAGIRVPDGFATTAAAFWHFLDHNKLRPVLSGLLLGLDREKFSNLSDIGKRARALILNAETPGDLRDAVIASYAALCSHGHADVAVRSSATAEDLPEASFAGQHESYLNISGEIQLMEAVRACFASLYTDRAIKYREDNGFGHDKIALSVGIQKMVRSDKACSGVAFTLEPESGFRDVIHVAGVWGMGENIVQGEVSPDEFLVFKPSLAQGKKAIIQRRLGKKEKTMVYAGDHASVLTRTLNLDTAPDKREQFVMTDDEVTDLARWAVLIEQHYNKPMDIEWAKDGLTGEFFIVQARPETVQSRKNPFLVVEYELKEKGECLTKGEGVGERIMSGKARILSSPAEAAKLLDGEIIVTEMTSPDWDPILKRAGAILTNKGGRTSHASIVARELGVPAIVGTGDATEKIAEGETITVSCCEGKTGFVYRGKATWTEKQLDLSNIRLPDRTQVMLIVGDPDKAFELSFYPNEGVGLMRMEFIITDYIGIHPMALVHFDSLKDPAVQQRINEITHHRPDKEQFFIDKLSEGIATIAAAFFPKEVIVRMSDFKTNEYANLLGGRDFEPGEENPMLGFRGASRYYNDLYKAGFRLECEAIRIVREDMGLSNVKVMIPFCRTLDEGRKVIQVMKDYGLSQLRNDLAIYVMAEIPSNVLLAGEFAEIFDGFSIGSNDLTQLTLGIDRDSSVVAGIFNEQDKAVKKMIATMIREGREAGARVGLCGQAPSDFPDFARFLVEKGIDSISFNPDAVLKGIENINKAEAAVRAGQTAGASA